MHLNLLTSLVLACHSESDLRDPFANFHSFAQRIESWSQGWERHVSVIEHSQSSATCCALEARQYACCIGSRPLLCAQISTSQPRRRHRPLHSAKEWQSLLWGADAFAALRRQGPTSHGPHASDTSCRGVVVSGAPGSVDEMLQGMSRYDHTLVQETDRVWILARNPYSRILSLYLQKVANACKFGSLGCNDWEEQMKLASIMGYDASKPPSFPAFVELMAEMILRLQAADFFPGFVGLSVCLG